MDNLSSLNLALEQELVFRSIRVSQDQDEYLRQILCQELDWSFVRQTALQHGVMPLMYKRLKLIDEDLVPQGELNRLKEIYLANVKRNYRLSRMLLRIFDLFSSQGIEFIPIKGPALAVMLYGDINLLNYCKK